MGLGEIICGDLGRSAVFIFCAGGVVCSYFAMMSCEFFSYKSRDPELLPGPYFNVSSGSVGLFNHFDYEGGNPTTCDQMYSDNYFFIVFSKDASEEFNIYFIIAQFGAVVGPAGAALAFLFNLMEWCCCKLTVTFFFSFFLLFLGFVGQGMSFMIYGQTEFCFDDNATEDCSLEIGAYLSIAAAAAFYAASVMWCCMPRAEPILRRGRKDKSVSSSSSDVEETPKPSQADRDAPTTPQDEENGARAWQSFEKSPAFQQSGSGQYDDDGGDEPENATSSYFQGDAMGSSTAKTTPMSASSSSPTMQQQQQQSPASYLQQQQQQQQQQPPSHDPTDQTDQVYPPPRQQQEPPGTFATTETAQHDDDDFANPFEDGAKVQNYERPSTSSYNPNHP